MASNVCMFKGRWNIIHILISINFFKNFIYCYNYYFSLFSQQFLLPLHIHCKYSIQVGQTLFEAVRDAGIPLGFGYILFTTTFRIIIFCLAGCGGQYLSEDNCGDGPPCNFCHVWYVFSYG